VLPHAGRPLSVDERLRRILLGALVLGLGLSITLAQVALALLTLRFAYRLLTGRARPNWPLAWPFGALIAATGLSTALSEHPLTSLAASSDDVFLIATFYVLLDALRDTREVDRWAVPFFVLMAMLAIVGIVQVAACPWLEPLAPTLGRVARKCHRAHAFYSIYMTLAGVLSLVLLAALPRLLAGGGPRASWGFAAWIAGAAGLAATYVRGAWLGLLAGVALLLVLLPRRRLLVLGCLVGFGVLVLLVPDVRRRAESLLDPADPTARERWAMWASALAMARDHPLAGIGPGAMKREYPRYAAPEYRERSRSHVHNTPLQILVERGLLGLAAWAAIFVGFFWRAARILVRLSPAANHQRANVLGSIASIAGFLVGGMTEYNFGDSEVVLVAYALMALPFVVERASERNRFVSAAGG